MKKQVGIWIRVSTEDQVKGESPQHHEARARMYAELKGWTVKEVYNLEAVSGKSVIEHPEAKRMLRDIENGHIEGLIFSKLARLARNTRELLDFADIFRQYNADLISLQESIDTSTPAGRFFYTLIAAMAEWEREEIAERVRVSVPIRAKLGKSLGGEAPYGYKWVNQRLELDENEAPIRKLMFDLFTEVKRKRKVAAILNERGYRTRRGDMFGDALIDRCLRDPIAKGLRRVNYTKSTGDGKHWVVKPKEEWLFQPAPAIVSEELWDTCNQILDSMTTVDKKTRRSAVHLFSGILTCHCGTKMYMRSNSPAYVCNNCKNKILPDVIEEIFQEQLRSFIFSDTELANHLESEKGRIKEQETLLLGHQKRISELNVKIDHLFNLYYEGKLDKDAFERKHTPLNDERKQHEAASGQIQGAIDAFNMQSLSNDQVIHDARDLQSHWPNFNATEKRTIIEAITKSIIIGKEDIEINLNYIPTLVKNETPPQTPPKPAKQPFASPLLFLPFKLLQLCGARMPLWLLQSPGEGVRLRSRRGAEIPEQNFGSTPRPH